MKNFKFAYFDLDGTLADNYAAIHGCIAHTFNEFGVPYPDIETVKTTVGGSILMTVEKLLPDEKKSCAAEISQKYLENFPKFIFEGLRPMPYAFEILSALRSRGIKLACFSNKQQGAVEDIVERLGFKNFLDESIGTSLHSPRKPDREYTIYALERLSARADESIIIGDSPYDYFAAQNGGLASALVCTGGDTRESLEKACPMALGVFDDLKKLALGVFEIQI